jgi:hypothetical protein
MRRACRHGHGGEPLLALRGVCGIMAKVEGVFWQCGASKTPNRYGQGVERVLVLSGVRRHGHGEARCTRPGATWHARRHGYGGARILALHGVRVVLAMAELTSNAGINCYARTSRPHCTPRRFSTSSAHESTNQCQTVETGHGSYMCFHLSFLTLFIG